MKIAQLWRRTGTRALVALVLAGGGLIAVEAVTAGPAMAACPVEHILKFNAPRSTHIKAGTASKDGPGGAVTASVTRATTLSVSISGSIEASGSVIVVELKQQISSSITRAVAITTGHSYTHNIAKGRYGHLEYGSWGYAFSWTEKRVNPNCKIVTIGSGRGTAPTHEVGWRYWETSS